VTICDICSSLTAEVYEVIGVINLENLVASFDDGICGPAITSRMALILSHAIFLQVNLSDFEIFPSIGAKTVVQL